MDAEQAVEWKGILATARIRLRNGPRAERPKGRLVQLLIFTSFEDQHAYEVFLVDRLGKPKALAVHSVWETAVDRQKLATPLERLKHPGPIRPSISERTGLLSEDQVASLRSALNGLRIAPSPTAQGVTLDGTSHELVTGDRQYGARLLWSNAPPPEWVEVGAFADLLRRTVEAAVAGVEDDEKDGED